MNVLVLYNATQTYTNAVFEHLQAFGDYSGHRYFFFDVSPEAQLAIDLSRFDAVGVHFSLRLPFDQIPLPVVNELQDFRGLKFLFIQDEYDNTHHAWNWIQRLGFHIVFTVVPEQSVGRIYPPDRFPNTKFVSVLTGYVPISSETEDEFIPPSKRSLVVGYRGRKLPLRYGALGFEKVLIGQMVAKYCKQNSIPHDIAWDEESRIYGDKWYEFLCSCRSMLGTESGSNIFDWSGDIDALLLSYKKNHPYTSDKEIYQAILAPREIDGVMNQISPKIFEAIAARTVLVLFEGAYSGVLCPERHYISLKKDGSNIDHVFELLGDDDYVDRLVDTAFKDIISSRRYSYEKFVNDVDDHLSRNFERLAVSSLSNLSGRHRKEGSLEPITTGPIVSEGPFAKFLDYKVFEWNGNLRITIPIGKLWIRLPESARSVLLPFARYVKKMLVSRG